MAGCASDDHALDAETAGAAAWPHAHTRHPPFLAARPEVSTPEAPLPIPTEKPPDAALLADRTDLDPQRLIGLSLVETEALLGEPALRDEKPPAKVWTYNAETCVLSIFFYADISTKDFRALTYEIKNDGKQERGAAPAEQQPAPSTTDQKKSEVAGRQCLAELMNEHAT